MSEETPAAQEAELQLEEAAHSAGKAAYKALCSLADCANRVFAARSIPAEMIVHSPDVKHISRHARAFTVAAQLSEKVHPEAMQLIAVLDHPLLVLTFATDGLVYCSAGSVHNNSQFSRVTRIANEAKVNTFVDKWLDTNLGNGIARIVRFETPKPALF